MEKVYKLYKQAKEEVRKAINKECQNFGNKLEANNEENQNAKKCENR